MTAHHEALDVLPGVQLVVQVTDGGEAFLDLRATQGAGNEPVLLNRMPIPREHLGRLGAALSRAGEATT